ncbi:hypothetical protein ACFQX4_22215 [Roseomonas sp. GCM10028921]
MCTNQATEQEVAPALAHALRLDGQGQARRGGGDLAAGLAVERLAELVATAAELGLAGLGICDTNSLAGVVGA